MGFEQATGCKPFPKLASLEPIRDRARLDDKGQVLDRQHLGAEAGRGRGVTIRPIGRLDPPEHRAIGDVGGGQLALQSAHGAELALAVGEAARHGRFLAAPF